MKSKSPGREWCWLSHLGQHNFLIPHHCILGNHERSPESGERVRSESELEGKGFDELLDEASSWL